MKLLIFILTLLTLLLPVFNSSESEEESFDVVGVLAKILNIELDDEIPVDQIPPNIPKETTLPVTPEMMEIVQKLRDHFGSAWNEK